MARWQSGKDQRPNRHTDSPDGTEDIGMAWLQFEGGAYGSLLCSTNMKPGFPLMLNVYGEKGVIRLSGAEMIDWEIDGLERPILDISCDFGKFCDGDPSAVPVTYHRI